MPHVVDDLPDEENCFAQDLSKLPDFGDGSLDFVKAHLGTRLLGQVQDAVQFIRQGVDILPVEGGDEGLV